MQLAERKGSHPSHWHYLHIYTMYHVPGSGPALKNDARTYDAGPASGSTKPPQACLGPPAAGCSCIVCLAAARSPAAAGGASSKRIPISKRLALPNAGPCAGCPPLPPLADPWFGTACHMPACGCRRAAGLALALWQHLVSLFLAYPLGLRRRRRKLHLHRPPCGRIAAAGCPAAETPP